MTTSPAPYAVKPKPSFRPLSASGLPKEPQAPPYERCQGYSGLGFLSPELGSSRSPVLSISSSPALSVKSFGTFIDSRPTTPAHSPRPDDEWNNSALIRMQPGSSSASSSPQEPEWEMMNPIKFFQPVPRPTIHKDGARKSMEMTRPTERASLIPLHPAAYITSPRLVDEINAVHTCHYDGKEEEELTDFEEDHNTAPLGKLANKVKMMLKRGSTIEEKKAKKAKYAFEVQHLDHVHWTEM